MRLDTIDLYQCHIGDLQDPIADSVRASWNEGSGRERFLQQLGRVKQLRFLARPGRTMAQAALQFVLARPAVTTAIPGAKSVDQSMSNAAAADGVLSTEELARIRDIGAAW